MNQIILALAFLCLLLLSACGQYGDLYAPPQEQITEETQEDSSQTTQQELQAAEQEQVKQDK